MKKSSIKTLNDYNYLELKKNNGYEYVSRKIGKKGGVVIIPIFFDKENNEIKFQLILNKRPTFSKPILEFPAGLIDKENENKIEVAARELKEETGWNAEFPFSAITNFPAPSSAGITDELIYLVPAYLTTKEEPNYQEGEDIVVLPLMNFIELSEYMDNNRKKIYISSRLLTFYLGILYGLTFPELLMSV